MSLTSQVNLVCKSSHFQIRDIRRIRNLIPLSIAITLADSLVSSRLDYCNSLHFGMSKRTSRNSSVYKILLRGPSHKLQSISTSLQFSQISTGSLSLNGLSIKFLFSLSRPSWMAIPLSCINIWYLRHIIHQPDHPRLLLFSFQEPEHRLVSARSLLLLQGYGTHCLMLYAQQRPFLLFDLNSKLTSSKLPSLPRLFSLLPDWYYGLMHWVIHVWAPSNDIFYILDTAQ